MPAIVVATAPSQAQSFGLRAHRFVPPEDRICLWACCTFDEPIDRSALPVGQQPVTDANPADAIVQLVQQHKADLLIVQVDAQQGLSTPSVQLADALAKAKPCTVLAVDTGTDEEGHWENVVVPIDTNRAWAAMNMALSVIDQRGKVRPALLTNTEDSTPALTERREHQLLRKWWIESSQRIEPVAECIEQPRQRLRELANQADLIILSDGSPERLVNLRKGDTEQKLLPISKQTAAAWITPNRTNARFQLMHGFGFLLRWVPQLSRDERLDLTTRLQDGATWNANFVVMMGLSTAIAALGLMQDSAAVVIGAMLVAPLMTPLIAGGWAMTQGNTQMFKTAAKTLGFGVAAGLGLAFVLGFFNPRDTLTDQIMARSAPDLLDLGVAALSGVAAAYALSRSQLSAALPGVAIAAALVPPLSCIGMALAFGSPKVAFGAATLLTANLATITLAAALTFRVLGVRMVRRTSNPKQWTRHVAMGVSACILAVALPLWQQTARHLNQSSTDTAAPGDDQGNASGLMERVIGTASHRPDLFEPVPAKLQQALLDTVAQHPNVMPMAIGRPLASQQKDGAPTWDVTLTLASNGPLPEALLESLQQAADKQLERKAKLLVVPVQAIWPTTKQPTE